MTKIPSHIIQELKNNKNLSIIENVKLSEITNWKTGGTVRAIIKTSETSEIIYLRKLFKQHNIPNLIIGETSNLLFCDTSIDAIFIKVIPPPNSIQLNKNIISCSASVYVPYLARFAMQNNLSGLEHTCGIPGSVGGLIYMNGGSLRLGIGDSIKSVTSVNENGDVTIRSQDECGFSYRNSIFQKSNDLILAADILLEKENSKTIRTKMIQILRSRRLKFPRKEPNCGSVFVSDPRMYKQYGPPGAIIERLGLKGFSIGGAQVSQNHANFIINTGLSSSKDIISLIKFVRDSVFNETGYKMKVEPRFVNQSGEIIPIDEMV